MTEPRGSQEAPAPEEHLRPGRVRSMKAARRRRALWASTLSALIVVGGAEAAARTWGDELPETIEWYDATTQRKVEAMDAMQSDGLSPEVVFAGTSMAWQAFDPQTFARFDPEGRRAYNGALAGGVPVVMERWLLEEVVPRLRPDLVVWGLSTLDLAPGYGSDNLELYEGAPAVRTGGWAEMTRRASRWSSLVRHRVALRDASAWDGGGPDDAAFAEADRILGPGGVRREFTAAPDISRAREAATRLAGWEPDPADEAAIRATVAALAAGGVDVVFAPMPVPERYVSLHPNGRDDQDRFSARLTELAEELDVQIIDATAAFDDDAFVDFTHLDEPSTLTFTKRFTLALAGAEEGDRPATWELVADVVADGTPQTDQRRAGLFSRMDETVHRSAALAETLHSVLNPSAGLIGIEAPLYWYDGLHRAKQRQIDALAAAGAPIEVLFTGTSKVWFGIDPATFTAIDGRPAYNAALRAVGPRGSGWLTRTVVPTLAPDIVVWGLSAYDLAGQLAANESRMRDVLARQERAFGEPPWADIVPDPFEPPDGIEVPRTWRPDAVDEISDELGHHAETVVRLGDAQRALAAYHVEDIGAPDPTELEAIRITIGQLRDAGTEVVLVDMPVPDRLRELQPPGAPEAMSAALAALAAEMDTELLDFSRALPDDRFADYTHLLASGAQELTRLLADRLRD